MRRQMIITRESRQARRPGSRVRRSRYGAIAAVTAGLAALSLLAVTGGIAAATPKPTVAQVQKKLRQLNTSDDKLDRQLNQAKDDLASATRRLRTLNSQARRYSRQFNTLRAEVGRIAAQSYMQGTMNSPVALLTSGDPQQILSRSSMLTELSSANTAQMRQFIKAAR